MGQQLSDASRDLATFNFDLGGHDAIVGGVGLRAQSVYRLCKKFEVRTPSHSEDIAHLLCEH